MLLAGWEVRIVKNCDRGLENAVPGRRPEVTGPRSQARGHRPEVTGPRSQFFTIRTDPKPDNNILVFFSCGNLAYEWVCLRNFVIKLNSLQAIHTLKNSNERTSE